MAKRASDNLRIKRAYLDWLRHAKGLSEMSIDKAAASIDRWFGYIGAADLRRFHTEKAVAFKRHLEKAGAPTGRPLSDASRDGILRDLRAFFLWLADQPGYRSKVRHRDAQWFTPDRRSARGAHQGQWRPHPSPEQMRAVILRMPSATVIERRDRALMAFLFLTGSRETAAMTVRLRHVELTNRCVQFDGRQVETKNGKRFTSFFFPVGEEIEAVLAEWVDELKRDLLFGPTDPLFPKTAVRRGPSGGFEAAGLLREPWASPGAIVRIFKSAFTAADLSPFGPHSIRRTLVDLANVHCVTPEDFKAWSQNLGHEEVLTTFQNYGSVSAGRQRELLERFRKTPS